MRKAQSSRERVRMCGRTRLWFDDLMVEVPMVSALKDERPPARRSPLEKLVLTGQWCEPVASATR